MFTATVSNNTRESRESWIGYKLLQRNRYKSRTRHGQERFERRMRVDGALHSSQRRVPSPFVPTGSPTPMVRVHPFSGSAARVRYTESPRGSRKAVDCRQPRQTAHCSHTHCSFGDTRPLAHPRLLAVTSLSRPLSLRLLAAAHSA